MALETPLMGNSSISGPCSIAAVSITSRVPHSRVFPLAEEQISGDLSSHGAGDGDGVAMGCLLLGSLTMMIWLEKQLGFDGIWMEMTLVGNRDLIGYEWRFGCRGKYEKLNILMMFGGMKLPRTEFRRGQWCRSRGWNGVSNFQTNPPGSTLGKQSLWALARIYLKFGDICGGNWCVGY